MYPVTAEYKAALNQSVREPSYIKIVFGVTDPDAPGASTITAPQGQLPYSNAAAVDRGSTVPLSYATLELNRFILTGRTPLPVKENPIWQGYIGTALSDGECVYAEPPILHIEFSDYFEFPGLSFQFDTAMKDYPTELQIIAYNNGGIVFDRTFNPTSAEFGFQENIPTFNSMDIKAKKSNLPYRRFRVTQLIYGLVQTISDNEISAASFSRSSSLLSTELPKYDFDFTIFDSEHRYDPENPQGLWEYLEERQNVTVSIGQYLDADDEDNRIEIPLCTTYSTGEFNVSGQGEIVQVNIKTTGLASHLTDTYIAGVYEPDGVSLYDLARRVTAYAGYDGVVTIDEALKNIYTHIPLPKSPVNQCLQLIANAGRCIMTHSRGGYLQIVRESTEPVDFGLDFNGMFSEPATSKIPKLRSIITSYTHYELAKEQSDAVSEVEVQATEPTQFILDHTGAFTNCSISTSGVTVVGTPEYYAYCTVVTLQGTGKVTVKGYAVDTSNVSYSKQYGLVGQDLDSVNNELIDNATDASAYADWVADVTMRRTTYETENRGYPYIDIGDRCTVDSNFATAIEATVTEDKLDYNGAITGATTFISTGVES